MTTNTQTTTAPFKIEEERFEFVFYVNNHIIVQRFFKIPNFNEELFNPTKSKDLTNKENYDETLKTRNITKEIRESYLIKELLDNIVGINKDITSCGIIPTKLKEKSIDFLWDNYNPHYAQTEENIKNSNRKIDTFKFEIKVDKEVIGSTEFKNYFYPLSAINGVNIKDTIPSIMGEIRHFLSQKK